MNSVLDQHEAIRRSLGGNNLVKNKKLLNDEQYKIITKIAHRVMRELDAEHSEHVGPGEPLRWVMHGGPGTGKSHVITIVKERLSKQVLHWDLGVHFQVVALQAVMAELLGGDTIHHACGIPAFKRVGARGDDEKKRMEAAKKSCSGAG